MEGEVFGCPVFWKENKKPQEGTPDLDQLYARIGQLKVDNNLKKAVRNWAYEKRLQIGFPLSRKLLIRKQGEILPYPGAAFTIRQKKKNLKIERPNQVWVTNITYIPMSKGLMYMTAVMDVYSRKVLS